MGNGSQELIPSANSKPKNPKGSAGRFSPRRYPHVPIAMCRQANERVVPTAHTKAVGHCGHLSLRKGANSLGKGVQKTALGNSRLLLWGAIHSSLGEIKGAKTSCPPPKAQCLPIGAGGQGGRPCPKEGHNSVGRRTTPAPLA